MSAGFRVAFLASLRLFGELRLAKADGSYVRELEKIGKHALLIIDDFGQRRGPRESKRNGRSGGTGSQSGQRKDDGVSGIGGRFRHRQQASSALSRYRNHLVA